MGFIDNSMIFSKDTVCLNETSIRSSQKMYKSYQKDVEELYETYRRVMRKM